MPTASRAQRQKRRIRRNLSLYRRLAHQEGINRAKVTVVLLAALAQNNGQIEISQETLDSTVRNLGKAQYVVEKLNPNSEPFDGRWVIKLVATEDATAEATTSTFATPAGPTDPDNFYPADEPEADNRPEPFVPPITEQASESPVSEESTPVTEL